jgi:predicted transcriptional regulator
MPTSKAASAVLTIRVPRALDRRLTALARRSRQSRSEAARAILEAALGNDANDPSVEARRQSVLASRQDADRDTLAFLDAVADDRGWR